MQRASGRDGGVGKRGARHPPPAMTLQRSVRPCSAPIRGARRAPPQHTWPPDCRSDCSEPGRDAEQHPPPPPARLSGRRGPDCISRLVCRSGAGGEAWGSPPVSAAQATRAAWKPWTAVPHVQPLFSAPSNDSDEGFRGSTAFTRTERPCPTDSPRSANDLVEMHCC